MSVLITLESWEDIHAHHVGISVHYANSEKRDRVSYDKSKLQPDNDRASIDAARAEVAVARAYGGFWHAGHWAPAEHFKHHDKHSDITLRRLNKDNEAVPFGIEVKRRRNGTRVPIDEKDYVNDHLIVWAQVYGCDADNHFPRVEIIGEARASTVWDGATPWGNDPKRRWFQPDLLQQPSVLAEYR